MKTVGNILKEARLAKKLTYEQVEAKTKIRVKFLEAIEEDDYRMLPSVSYAKGFVKNYGEFLGIPAETTLAFFRRQTKDVARSAILPKGVSESLNRSWFQLTPGKFLLFLIVGLATIFLSYLGLQYRQIQNPPKIIVEAPADNAVTVTRKIDLFGVTDTDATVTVNGVSVLVRSDGKFFDQVSLEPGTNTITIVASSRFGKTSTVTRSVSFQNEETR